MTSNETQELLEAMRSIQRDIACDLPVSVFAKANQDLCDLEFVRPDELGKVEKPGGLGWVEIRSKKEKQELLALYMSRFAQDLSESTSRTTVKDGNPLLQSWQSKGARRRNVAITNAPLFLQGGAPGLIQQKL